MLSHDYSCNHMHIYLGAGPTEHSGIDFYVIMHGMELQILLKQNSYANFKSPIAFNGH